MFKVGTTNEAVRVAWIRSTLAALPTGLTILDAGAGESQFKPFCKHLKYISQDIAEYEGTGAVGLQTGTWDTSKLDIVSDIIDIPIENGSVDAVLCTEVFEHLPNPILAIKEFSRILRPGGYLVLTAPFFSATHFAPYHYATGFNRFFYETHLPSFGFRIDELALNGTFFDAVAQELRRVRQVAEGYSSTRLSILDRAGLLAALRVLDKLERVDDRSAELLCFGVHVLARRESC